MTQKQVQKPVRRVLFISLQFCYFPCRFDFFDQQIFDVDES